jgi:hypothetical protein
MEWRPKEAQITEMGSWIIVELVAQGTTSTVKMSQKVRVTVEKTAVGYERRRERRPIIM